MPRNVGGEVGHVTPLAALVLQKTVDRERGELAVLHGGHGEILAAGDAVAAGPDAGQRRPALFVDDDPVLSSVRRFLRGVAETVPQHLLPDGLEHHVRFEDVGLARSFESLRTSTRVSNHAATRPSTSSLRGARPVAAASRRESARTPARSRWRSCSPGRAGRPWSLLPRRAPCSAPRCRSPSCRRRSRRLCVRPAATTCPAPGAASRCSRPRSPRPRAARRRARGPLTPARPKPRNTASYFARSSVSERSLPSATPVRTSMPPMLRMYSTSRAAKSSGVLYAAMPYSLRPPSLSFGSNTVAAVPEHREAMRAAQARGSAADHRDLAPGRRRAFEQRRVVLEDRIRGVALQQADAHRPVFVRVAHAGFLAQHLGRAHARAHAAHDVFAEDGVRRALEIAAADLLDESRNVDAGGAGGGAGRVVAEVAAVGVDDRFGRRQRRMHVREVGRDLFFAEAPGRTS